jgi:hypothetical protein
VRQHADDKLDQRGQRHVNEMVSLRVPMEIIAQKCALSMPRGKPAQRAQLLDDSDYSISASIKQSIEALSSTISWPTMLVRSGIYINDGV